MVCEEDTTANGTAMGGLSRCVLKGTRTVLRGGRGSDAPNLPDLIKSEHICAAVENIVFIFLNTMF
ncbi:hypothetical protein [Priestia sp. YIM B13551]|uniref:hypothetical protein n=1 Tax=Priestia sp. YIM B13551 TaxID=3366306 RepID=UPI00366BDF9A